MCEYPLLDIDQAVKDCDRTLADINYYVQVLQQETEGHSPPDAALVLANVAALRELLGWLIPPALQAAITAEQVQYEDDADRWEPVNY